MSDISNGTVNVSESHPPVLIEGISHPGAKQVNVLRVFARLADADRDLIVAHVNRESPGTFRESLIKGRASQN